MQIVLILYFDNTSLCQLGSQSAHLSTIMVPQFDDVLYVHEPVNKVPATLQHLHQLAMDIRTLDIGLSTYYTDLRVITPLLSVNVSAQAHVDGGSIAATMDHKIISSHTKHLLPTRSVSPSSISKWPTIQSTSHLV